MFCVTAGNAALACGYETLAFQAGIDCFVAIDNVLLIYYCRYFAFFSSKGSMFCRIAVGNARSPAVMGIRLFQTEVDYAVFVPQVTFCLFVIMKV